jgi:hypothetical protein
MNPLQVILNMKKLHSIMKKQSLIISSAIFLVLFMNACATFKKPATINEAPILERALTKEDNGIRVSASVLGDQEARQIFGIDLARKKIQAMWIEVENNADRPLILLPTAIDPEYFAPLEVSFAYHKALAADANAALDAHLLSLNFPIRNLIQPGSRASGYIFTNWIKGMKVVDVDLVGDGFSQSFTFFTPNPDSSLGQDIIGLLEAMFSASELQKVESEAELRQALEQLPCCVSNENGGLPAEPLNLVIIGALDDWTTAFTRRGYRYRVLNPRYAYGRAQDISGRKLSRGYTKAQAHTIRLWQTPIRYDGKPVWVAQTSTRLGGRFAEKAPVEVTSPINPKVDEARYDLAQDLAYSQALIKIGFTKNAERSPSTLTAEASADVQYTTDGLRVILVFGDRPASLEEIDFFNWEQLADYR